MLFALSRKRKRGDEIIRWEIAPRILLLPSINLKFVWWCFFASNWPRH